MVNGIPVYTAHGMDLLLKDLIKVNRKRGFIKIYFNPNQEDQLIPFVTGRRSGDYIKFRLSELKEIHLFKKEKVKDLDNRMHLRFRVVGVNPRDVFIMKCGLELSGSPSDVNKRFEFINSVLGF